MAARRRFGAEGAVKRELLIQAAAQIFCEEGHAAISARRVAERAGLKPELVFYYFPTMDDVIVGVIRQNVAQRKKRLEQAVENADPLRALWEVNSDRAGALMTSELLALANHRASIREEVVMAARAFRRFQIDAVHRILEGRGVKDSRVLAGAIVTMGAALGRALAQDCALGVSEGYAEALTMLEEGLRRVGGMSTETKD